MEHVYKKIFMGSDESIKLIDYDGNGKKYFDLIQKQHKEGNRQIVITSDIMMNTIEFFYNETNFELVEIKLAYDEDSEFSKSIGDLIGYINLHRHDFHILLETLELFRTKDSIEISEIELKNRYSIIKIKSNGILTLTSNFNEDILNTISNVIGKNFL